MTSSIRSATDSDLVWIREQLASAGLPTEDLRADPAVDFLVAVMPDGALGGAVGLETLGDVGLLRSLVVSPDSQGQGTGALLVAALERRAADHALKQLWLLTIDAERYFENLGYVITDRLRAPPAIRATAEFSDLCPGTAHVMMKSLG